MPINNQYIHQEGRIRTGHRCCEMQPILSEFSGRDCGFSSIDNARNDTCSRLDGTDELVDSKHAWMVAIGTFCLSLLGGVYYTWGVMQDFYQRTSEFSSEKHVGVQLALVGITHQLVMLSSTAVGSMLYTQIGYRRTIVVCMFISSGGMMLSSLATSIWHLVISYGFITGFGCAIGSSIGFRIIPQWFEKYQSTAFGIQSSMYPCFGLLVPFLTVYINNVLGHRWTFRILGISFVAISGIGLALVKERVPTKKQDQRKDGQMSSDLINALKNFDLMVWMLIAPIQTFFNYALCIYLPAYSTYIGLSEFQGGAIIVTFAALTCVSGIFIGMAGDKFGNLNTQMTCATISTVCVFGIWMMAYSFGMLMVFAILIGLFGGSHFVLMASVAIEILGNEKYPIALVIFMPAYAIGTLGILFSSFLETFNDKYQPFFYCKIVLGVGCALCIFLSMILKFRRNRKVFAKV